MLDVMDAGRDCGACAALQTLCHRHERRAAIERDGVKGSRPMTAEQVREGKKVAQATMERGTRKLAIERVGAEAFKAWDLLAEGYEPMGADGVACGGAPVVEREPIEPRYVEVPSDFAALYATGYDVILSTVWTEDGHAQVEYVPFVPEGMGTHGTLYVGNLAFLDSLMTDGHDPKPQWSRVPWREGQGGTPALTVTCGECRETFAARGGHPEGACNRVERWPNVVKGQREKQRARQARYNAGTGPQEDAAVRGARLIAALATSRLSAEERRAMVEG